MATRCTCGAGGGGDGGGAQSKKLLKRRTTKKGETNPYSDRGVDKFSALLAEVEEKKRMIYSQLDPEDVSMIRFVYGSDNKLKPLVVRADKKAYRYEEAGKVKVEEEKTAGEDGGDVVGPVGDQERDEKKEKLEMDMEMEVGGEKKKSWLKELKFSGFQVQPWHYQLGGMVILVLLLMTMFGRYWKSFYLVQLQAAVCPRVERG